MLEFHTSAHAARRGASDAARANVARPLMTKNFGKYRAALSRRKVRAVETWLGDLMDRFGYEREFVDAARPHRASTLWPQWTEPFERLVNRETGPFYFDGQKRFRRRLRGLATPRVPRPYDATTSMVDRA
jgi:hypothetical protein